MAGGNDSGSRRCDDYVKGLEEERRKIQVFKRELPLCLDLVTRAIEACKCKQQLSESTCEYNFLGQSTRADSSDFADEQMSEKENNSGDCCCCSDEEGGNYKKSDWLHLWNESPESDPPSSSNSKQPIPSPTAVKDGVSPPAAAEAGGAIKKPEKKARRCWSPELHQRFLQALQHLGGSQFATPKQIRELMKEDGLSNDEIKSHLQKYRLHTRRAASETPFQTRPQQFVVVREIWVPPSIANGGGN